MGLAFLTRTYLKIEFIRVVTYEYARRVEKYWFGPFPLREKVRMRGIKRLVAVSMTPTHPALLSGGQGEVEMLSAVQPK